MGKPPKHLGKYGREIWEALEPRLDRLGITGSDDRWLFEQLCQSYDLIRKAENVLMRRGMTTKDGRKRPAVLVLKDARQQFTQLCGQFGLSPSTRGKVSATSGETVGDPRKPALRIG